MVGPAAQGEHRLSWGGWRCVSAPPCPQPARGARPKVHKTWQKSLNLMLLPHHGCRGRGKGWGSLGLGPAAFAQGGEAASEGGTGRGAGSSPGVHPAFSFSPPSLAAKALPLAPLTLAGGGGRDNPIWLQVLPSWLSQTLRSPPDGPARTAAVASIAPISHCCHRLASTRPPMFPT